MIYVDSLLPWPGPPAAGAERYFGNGKWSCHLWADAGEEDALHQFAEGIGLKRAWYQTKHFLGHYDLTPGKRRLALKAGAVPMEVHEYVEREIAARDGDRANDSLRR